MASEEEWTALPADPDLEEDLGYELIDLEVIDVPQYGQTMFLPQDEEVLRDEAFIIASDCLVCDPVEHR